MNMKHAWLGVLLVAVGCGGGTLTNKSESSVGNLFTYSATLKGYTGNDSASWSPTTTQAWVAWTGTSLTAGDVEVQLFDASALSVGNETANSSSIPPGQATTVGMAGTWRIALAFNGASGTLSLNIQGSTGGMP